MDESNHSDNAGAPAAPPARVAKVVPDVLVSIGVLSAATGAGLFHLGLGLIVFGAVLILIGSRGAATGG